MHNENGKVQEGAYKARLASITMNNIGVALHNESHYPEAKAFLVKAHDLLVLAKAQDKGATSSILLAEMLQQNENLSKLASWAKQSMLDVFSIDSCFQEAALAKFRPIFVLDDDIVHERCGSSESSISTSINNRVHLEERIDEIYATLLYNLSTLAASCGSYDSLEYLACDLTSLVEKSVQICNDCPESEKVIRLCVVTQFYVKYFQTILLQEQDKCSHFSKYVRAMEDIVLLGCGMLRGSTLPASLYIVLAQLLHQEDCVQDCQRIMFEASKVLENEPIFLRLHFFTLMSHIIGNGAPAA